MYETEDYTRRVLWERDTRGSFFVSNPQEFGVITKICRLKLLRGPLKVLLQLGEGERVSHFKLSNKPVAACATRSQDLLVKEGAAAKVRPRSEQNLEPEDLSHNWRKGQGLNHS